MNLDFDNVVAPGLRRYVRQVTGALGLSGESSCLQEERPASVYLALDGRLPEFPEHDVALLWDEQHGWSVAVENTSVDDLTVVGHMDDEVLPAPKSVAEWVAGLFVPRPRDIPEASVSTGPRCRTA